MRGGSLEARRRLAVLAATFGLLAGSALAQSSDGPIVIGNKQTIQSKILREERTLLISTPSSHASSDERYPVLYVLGGRGRFHYTTGVVDFLAANGRIPELMVVAIPQTNRIRDLTTPSTAEADKKRFPTQGGADNFLRFLSEEVIGFIDDRYRTRPYRILVGHSAGGLFAIHSLTTRPEVFDAYIVMSPSLQWSDQGVVAQAEEFFESTPELEKDLYMTVGDEGSDLLDGVRKMSRLLDENTPRGFRWELRPMEEESHGSVSLRSTYQGLEAIFRGWTLPDALLIFDEGGLVALDKYFSEVGRRFGYERTTPASTLYDLGFRLIRAERLEEAASVMLRDPESPPPSIVLDMLAVEFVERDDNERAKELYIMSLEQSPGNQTARTKLEEMGVDVDALLSESNSPGDGH